MRSCQNICLPSMEKPVAANLHATLVLHTRHCAWPAETTFIAFAVVCQSESSIVSADPAVPAAERDQWLVFEVTDTGCGISQRGLASLFTEYVQVSTVCNLSVVQWRSVALHVHFCCVSSCQLLLLPSAFASAQSCTFTCHAECWHV